MTTLPSENGGLILESDWSKRAMFDTWPEITDQKQATWSMLPVVGRSEEIPVYSSSRSRVLSVAFKLVSSAQDSDTGTPEDMEKRLNFIKSLTYPGSKNGFSTHPPLVWLICGDAYNLKGFVTDYRVSMTEAPWDVTDDSQVTLPLMADVQLKFTSMNDFNPTSEGVMNMGDNYQDIHPDSYSSRDVINF